MSKSNIIIELENKFTFEVYPKRKIIFTEANMSTLFDIDGNPYIDMAAGIGVANFGHHNEEIISSLKSQLDKLIVCPGIFYNDTRTLFLEKLISIVPKNLKKAFLCNSGSEAIEAAIKFARYTTKKTEFICFNRSFHGRTLGALSATYDSKYKEDFEPLIDGFHHVSFNNYEKVLGVVSDNTAGVIIELVQGEGGVNIADSDFVSKIRTLCTEKGILLIVDEIQTGFCRTGEIFACSHYQLQPDILCLAKSIAGGIPMGAVVCADNVTIDIGKHGTTFGGNPLACAGGIATIDYLLKNNIANQSKEKGDYLAKKLNEIKSEVPVIRKVKQIGLMIGIELKKRVKEYIERLLIEENVIALPAGKTVLRLLPPLVISYKEIDSAFESIIKVLKEPK